MAHDQATKDRARELRRAGLSVSQIARELGLRSHSMIQRWVNDIAVPEWTRRPRAKDAQREQARELRRRGATYSEIVAALSVSKSTVSRWVGDLPVPADNVERARHANRMNDQRWERERVRRDQERERVKALARTSVGTLSDREMLLVGVGLYWAEGVKDKPYARREKVSLINSDPQIISVFLRWLELMAVPQERLRYRRSIHELADVDAAHEYWSSVTGVPVSRFDRPSLKHHKPKTVRLNVGPDYHGCLVIAVLQSRVLYQQIDGMFQAIASAQPPGRIGDRLSETG